MVLPIIFLIQNSGHFMTVVRPVLLSLAALALIACGGSNESATLSQAETDASSVSILIGDSPIDEFDQAIIETTQIVLIGEDDGQLELLSEPVSIDLLALENISELVIDDVTVPAGDYSKLRLVVSSITLNRTDVDGVIIPGESVEVDVPSSGRLDLNPRGTITVPEAGNLALEIDVDLDSAVRLQNNGGFRFRPVIFINSLSDDNRGRITRLHGVVRNIDTAEASLELCNSVRLSSDDDANLGRCVQVQLTDTTEYFDETAEPISLAELIDGEEATVFGTYRNRRISAQTVAVGERRNFSNLEGEFSNILTEGELFEVVVDDLRGIAEDTSIQVRLSSGAIVVNDDEDDETDSDPTTAASIIIGEEIEARGLLTETDDGAPLFIAFIVLLDNDEDEDEDEDDESEEDGDDADEDIELVGSISSLDLANDRLTLIDDNQTEVCVLLDDDTEFFRIETTEDSTQSTEIALADLTEASSIEVSGELDDDSAEQCVEAENIVVIGEG